MLRILLDSSSDYLPLDASRRSIDVLPMTVTVGGREYQDGVSIDPERFYTLAEASDQAPHTSQPSPLAFADYFTAAKEAGDEVLFLGISSALSGTLQSAELAKGLAAHDKVRLVDTRAATVSIRILADFAADLRDAGCSTDEIVDYAQALVPQLRIYAGLDTLSWLANGGRIPASAAKMANAAKLKPCVALNAQKGLEVTGVAMGVKRSMDGIIKTLRKTKIDTRFPFYVVYTQGRKNPDRFAEKLADAGIQVTGVMQVGSCIGTHIGPGAFGCAFVERA
jgi:DegV family protein with EDD domain